MMRGSTHTRASPSTHSIFQQIPYLSSRIWPGRVAENAPSAIRCEKRRPRLPECRRFCTSRIQCISRVFSFSCYLRPIAGSLARREPTKLSSELGRGSLRMAIDLQQCNEGYLLVLVYGGGCNNFLLMHSIYAGERIHAAFILGLSHWWIIWNSRYLCCSLIDDRKGLLLPHSGFLFMSLQLRILLSDDPSSASDIQPPGPVTISSPSLFFFLW